MQAVIHTDFIRRYVGPGDAGCGPGRFSIVVAELGATVTALDLSNVQLQLAKERLGKAGVLESVGGFVSGDIADLSMFQDGHFDVVICYGGALSYQVTVMPPYMCGQGVGSRPVSSTGQALRGNDGFTAHSK